MIFLMSATAGIIVVFAAMRFVDPLTAGLVGSAVNVVLYAILWGRKS